MAAQEVRSGNGKVSVRKDKSKKKTTGGGPRGNAPELDLRTPSGRKLPY